MAWSWPLPSGVNQCPGALSALASVSCGGEKPSLLRPNMHVKVDRGRRAALEWLGACILGLNCLTPAPLALVLEASYLTDRCEET